MAVSAVELLQVAPPTPLYGCVVDDEWIVQTDWASTASQPGTLPRGTFAVMNTITETAKVYTGLGYWISGVVAHGGYAWTTSVNNPDINSPRVRTLHRIDPATGTVTDFTVPNLSHGTKIALVGGHIWVANYGGNTHMPIERFSLSTLSWSSQADDPLIQCHAMIMNGSTVYVFGTNVDVGPPYVARLNASTGAYIDQTWLGGASDVAPSGAEVVNALDGNIWWMVLGNIRRFNPSTLTVSSFARSGNGFQPCIGFGGNIYWVNGPSTFVICDLAGVSSTQTIPNRSARGGIYWSQNRLWIPSGAPY